MLAAFYHLTGIYVAGENEFLVLFSIIVELNIVAMENQKCVSLLL